MRVHARLLDTLYDYYGRPEGSHWKVIRADGVREKYLKPVWSGLSKILFAASDKSANIAHAVNTLSSVFDDEFEKSVQTCLEEIQHFDILPVAVIEPIETPISILEGEDVNLSEMLIVSLLDLYVKDLKFSPVTNQWMRLEISIPWHRNVDYLMREPQKTAQPTGRFNWSGDLLRAFINKRIEHEFTLSRKPARRRGKDAWEELFGEKIRNVWNGKNEDTFQYFLRHTHHRTRDMIRLARNAVKAHVDTLTKEYGDANVDDVFLGKTHVTVMHPKKISIENYPTTS